MLRKIYVLIVLVVFMVSCEKPHPGHYMSIKGKLENVTEKDSIIYITGFAVRKKIKVNPDGTFQDSLKITKPNYHTIMFGGRRSYIYLKNGYNLELTGDRDRFFNSLKFIGKDEAAHSNQMIVDQYIYGQSAGKVRGFMILEKEPFLKKIETYRKGMDSIVELYPNAVPKLVEDSRAQNEKFFKALMDNYEKSHDFFVKEKNTLEKLKTGKPAPEFKDFENYLGGKNSLSDYSGKYVYIDVWATWCRPCIVQIPYLKKLQDRYKGKNIEFISISTDDDKKSGGTWKEARNKWRQMIREKQLGGVHLWAGKNGKSFDENYWIDGIPRFILIDPQGKLIDYKARRPSDPKIIEILDDLLQ